jgi:UDP-glucose 4-epimerase
VTVDIAGKRFVLIGGAGFIGSHVAEQLLDADAGAVVIFDDLRRGSRRNFDDVAKDPRVEAIIASMTDARAARRAIEGCDGVFLLASLWLDECTRDPRAAWETNVIGTWNIVEACRDLGMPRLVYSSSASVYGDAQFVPMTEDHPLGNRTTYGATKIACEQMLRAASATWRQPFVGLRYMNVYGPRMDHLGAYVSVIVRMLASLTKGQPPTIHGDGSQTFDFVHVDDVARANVLAMTASLSDEFLNVGSGIGTSINDIGAILSRLMGVPFRPRYDVPSERPAVSLRVGSPELSKARLGFEARIEVEDGLRTVVDWWRDVTSLEMDGTAVTSP